MNSKRIQTKTRKPKLPKVDKINLPENVGDTVHTIFGEYILFVDVDADQDASNPLTDCDGIGSIRSLSKRHIDSIDADEALVMLKDDKDVVALSYFEHGNSLWMVMGEPERPGVEFEWDGVRFAGIWIPDESVRESYMGQDGKTRREWMVDQAKSACEIYTQWLNGDVYGHTVGLYKLKADEETGDNYTEWDDYRFKAAIYEDSCWGHFGWDYAVSCGLEAAQYALGKLGYSKRAISKITEASK